MTIEIDLKLLPSQMKAIQSDSPVVLFLAARSSGKTELGARWLLKKCIQNKGVIGAIIAPTYRQAMNVVKKFQRVLDSCNIVNVFNRTPHFLKSQLPDHKNVLSVNMAGSKYATQLYVFSADSYDNVRGFEFKFVLMDELREFKREAYETFLPCMRGYGKEGYQQLLTTSCNGKDWIYETFVESERSDVEIIRSTTIENTENPPNLVDQLREQMSDRMFRQECLNEILDNDLNSMFYAFDDSTCFKTFENFEGQVWIASDQNVSPLTALIIKKSGKCSYVEDEIILEEANLVALVQEIKKKTNVNKLFLTGDRSGSNRTWTGAESFYKQLISALSGVGIKCIDKTNKVNPKVFNTTELVNRAFEKNELFISKRCKVLSDQLRKVRWKADRYEMDKKFLDGHATDCLRYFVACTADTAKLQKLGISLF